MRRTLAAALFGTTLIATATLAQDGPLRRAGRALDNTGKNIRSRVETEVVRGQVVAQERDLLGRVARRIEWDKQLVGSTIRMEVRPGGVVVLRGSALTDAVKLRAVDLVSNTIGVTSVVDELAVVKDVKVIGAAPPGPAVEVTPPLEITPPLEAPAPAEGVVKP